MINNLDCSIFQILVISETEIYYIGDLQDYFDFETGQVFYWSV